MKSLLIYLIGVSIVLQTTTAFSCYTCFSNAKGDCVSPDRFQLEDYTLPYEKFRITNSFSSVVSKFTNNQFSTARLVCTKTIFQEGNETMYERSCTINPEETDICAELRQIRNVVVCEICTGQACNSAFSLDNMWSSWILLISAAANLFFKYFCN